MKRKKWSELEEQTLLNKYSDLLNSGTLQKLKTREKKFKPIADQVNSLHHLQDPVTFPFKWSWRDVSIKVQNMRHQYLGVKQKIRVSDDEFNWKDGDNHWENFLRYKEVFGDVEIEGKSGGRGGGDFLKGCLGFEESESEDLFEGEEGEEEEEGGFGRDKGDGEVGKGKREVDFGGVRRLGLVSAQVGELTELVVRREEKRREREFDREECGVEREGKRREMAMRREMRVSEREERVEVWDMELEERELGWARREFERRVRLEKELEEERRKRRMAEERRVEEEMEWRERMVVMQIEHEKVMMQLHADACQNQMQILGLLARLVCQFFGSPNDGLGAGLGGLPPQVLQNLHHSGGLDDNGKPDTNSPSEFL